MLRRLEVHMCVAMKAGMYWSYSTVGYRVREESTLDSLYEVGSLVCSR